MAAPASSLIPIWKAPTARSIPMSVGITDGLLTSIPSVLLPGRISSHAAPDTPGSIHEGGELGYALVHAYGAAFDNPDLVVACVVGDGEAETGPLAASLAFQQVPKPRPVTARFSRSFISTATRSPTRPCSAGWTTKIRQLFTRLWPRTAVRGRVTSPG